jgi:hypothetical protein
MDMLDEWLSGLCSWASANGNVRELWLFGSRATGRSRPDSEGTAYKLGGFLDRAARERLIPTHYDISFETTKGWGAAKFLGSTPCKEGQ